MSARQCGSCGRDLRKGSVKRALVLVGTEMIPSLVCKRCSIRQVAIVIPPPVVVAPLCRCCKRETASVGSECVAALERSVKELTAANVRMQAELRPTQAEELDS